MDLEIKEVNDKQDWEGFLSKCKEKTFLQSYNWSDFNEKMGHKVFRLGVYRGKDLVATGLAIEIEARRGDFLFLPHGPNTPKDGRENREAILRCFLDKMREISKRRGLDFVRIAPLWERNKQNNEILKDFGFREAPIHIHPELTWELDISSSEREILMNMRKNTRYSVRKGERNKNVDIIKKQDMEGIEEFYRLYEITSKRHDFTPFSLEYLKKQFLSFSEDRQISVLLGKYKGETVAASVYVFWQGIGFYHHGASSLKYPKVPVSYSLMWNAIKEAKEKGCRRFNFWGVAPPDASKKHPWYGLSLFKRGFGGDYKLYVKTHDFVLSPKYWLNFLVETARRINRGV
ncbi:MAG: peptidoglycan bridge formation glycyltransferase FemA/FemB family protein [Candidatus Nealsonbacteria bacterium]|nr:peptidoglycan bridge formation glycyltransferase FemA/FemB family protein [Candidatus Nealsonbacteria bacterium]